MIAAQNRGMSGAWVYILWGRTGTLYTGAASNLHRRIREHRKLSASGFAARYDCHKLVYQERLDSMTAALLRAKTIKGWTRAKKIALIKSINPEWKDLAQFLPVTKNWSQTNRPDGR